MTDIWGFTFTMAAAGAALLTAGWAVLRIRDTSRNLDSLVVALRGCNVPLIEAEDGWRLAGRPPENALVTGPQLVVAQRSGRDARTVDAVPPPALPDGTLV